MLIGLATLIILLLGGGTDTFLLDPQLKKSVKTYVAEKERKREIIGIIDLIGKDQKSFLKKRKKYSNSLIELNTNYTSKPEEFKALFAEYHNQRTALQNSYLEHELKIRSLILENEWTAIMNALIEKPDKQKAQELFKKHNEKTYGGLIHACEKALSDKEALTRSKALLIDNQLKTETFMNKFLSLGYRHLESVQKYNVTRADFEPFRIEMDALHSAYLQSVIDLRFSPAGLATETEWKALGKELNGIFKKGKNMI